MQKKLLVLAIAALASTSAFADSTTTLYGVVDAAVANVSGSGLIGGTTVVASGLATSRFGVKNVEQLDGGLTAVVVLEYGLDNATNATVGTAAGATAVKARQQLLGLAGGFGTVAAGFLQTAGWDFGAKYNVVAGSLVSPLGNLTKGQLFLIGDQALANRAQRAVAYISPSIGGLTVAVNYATALDLSGAPLKYGTVGNFGDAANLNTSTTNAGVSATLVSLDYTAGPLSVGLVYAGTNAEAYQALDITEYALGVAYTADVAKITATYQTSKFGNADTTTNTNAQSSNSVYSIGAAIPVTAAGTVVLSYAGSTINNIASGALSQNATSYAVGYLQGLSKTTTAYLAYSGVTQSNGTSAVTVANDLLTTTAGGNSSVLALGLNKKF
jgi:predicted porin